ncbi:MAG: hypothetical protein AAF567_00890 [Actinomycetota bacterium]
MPSSPDPHADLITSFVDDPVDRVLDDVWTHADLVSDDPDCSPTKVCRNAREFSFEGIAEDGDADLGTSWRRLLEREGKLSTDGGSLRDLVLGPPSD